MLNVLFVDDDAMVLSAMKRLLRSMRGQWNAEFIDNGKDALAAMHERHFDVVVSDMRMPGMDGAELLSEIAKSLPETIRIILSGQASEEASLRVVGPAHQFLSKPCTPELLKETVDRACVLRKTLTGPEIRSIVTRVHALPSLPSVFHQLVGELSSPQCSIDRIAKIISQDVAMTAKILHLVNSSFFCLAQNVSNLSHAISLLGLGIIKSLVLSAGVFRHFEGTAANALDAMVSHSMLISKLAASVASHESVNSHLIDDTLAAGMLHDVGKLVLAAQMPNEYRKFLTSPLSSTEPDWQLEKKTFGASHAEVGGYLLAVWGLPNTVVEAVTFHHTPQLAPVTGFSPLAAIHVADAWARAFKKGGKVTLESCGCDIEFLKRVGLFERANGWLRLFSDFARTLPD